MERLPTATDVVECGPVWVSPHQVCELRVQGRSVRLSATLLNMITLLIQANGRVVRREELRQPDESRTKASRSVDVQIYRIRRALGPYGRFLISVPGRGYRVDVIGLSEAEGP